MLTHFDGPAGSLLTNGCITKGSYYRNAANSEGPGIVIVILFTQSTSNTNSLNYIGLRVT